MRDCHAEAVEMEPGAGHDGIEKRVKLFASALDVQRQVEFVHVQVGKARVVDGRAERMAHRVADHAEKLGVGIDDVVPIEPFEGGDGQLPRRRRGLLVEAGKRHKGAELLRENPADQAGGAHAQHDAVAGCLVEQVEGIEALVDVVGCVDELGYGLGTGLHDVRVEPADIPERAFEIMCRQDEPAARAGGKGCPDLLCIALASEVGILEIDEVRSRLKGREQSLQSRLLRIRPWLRPRAGPGRSQSPARGPRSTLGPARSVSSRNPH